MKKPIIIRSSNEENFIYFLSLLGRDIDEIQHYDFKYENPFHHFGFCHVADNVHTVVVSNCPDDFDIQQVFNLVTDEGILIHRKGYNPKYRTDLQLYLLGCKNSELEGGSVRARFRIIGERKKARARKPPPPPRPQSIPSGRKNG